MAEAGGCLFNIGYFFYTRTRIGYYYHNRDIVKAREKYKDEGHTIIHAADYGSKYTDYIPCLRIRDSYLEAWNLKELQITPVPVALDNYSYIILDTESNTCVVIDPGDPVVVQKVLDEKKITPAAVLTTHKHWDHSAGNSSMKQRYSGIRIYGGAGDNVPDVTHTVSDKEELQFGGLQFRVQCASGHTAGQVVYILQGAPLGAPDCLFSGDHLFLGGCGRMFECPPLKMLKSLDAVSRLSPETLIWPGHEYALDNLEFVCHIDPDNSEAQSKFSWSKTQRENKLRTCPSTLAEELTYNPFLRTHAEAILKAAGMVTQEEGRDVTASDDIRARVLKEIRDRKDQFKYIM